MRMKWLIAVLVSTALLAGCGSGTTVDAPKPEPGSVSAPYMQAEPGEAKDEVAELKRLKEEEEKARVAFEKNPKDEALKKKFVDSSVGLGLLYTNAVSVDRKEKYKLALQHLNQALKHDPENQDAKSMRDTIVNIYKSMGKPVPGES